MRISDANWYRHKISFIRYVGIFLLLFMGVFCTEKNVKNVSANNGIEVLEINYSNNTMKLKVTTGDASVSFSDINKKTWEVLPGAISNDGTITMDISWVSVSKNQVITLKGDQSGTITTVLIPKEASTFKATFNILKGTIIFNNAGSRMIEWRKKDSTLWNKVNVDTISTEMSYYFNHGATVIFRLAPTNGKSDSDVGMRPSKEVTVTIPKKSSAPTVKLDGSKFSISAVKGVEYRKINEDGNIGQWITKSISSDLLLSDIAPETLYMENGPMEKVTLQFRKSATGTAQLSHITTIEVPTRQGAPDEEEEGISLSYTSSNTLSLTIKSASTTNPFEYTIAKEGVVLDYRTTKWTTLNSNTAVKITSTTAPEGSRIFVRKKSVDASETVNYSMASKELEITGLNKVKYPEAAKVESLTKLITIAGVSSSSNTAGNLTFTLYSSTKTKVSSIEAYDIYGNKKGTLESKSTVSQNSNKTGNDDSYLITANITSTTSVDSITNELMYLTLTLENGEVIRSTSTTGVHMYLYPKSYVATVSEDKFTNDFKRIYSSVETDDEKNFKFKLIIGKDKVMDSAGVDKDPEILTAIQSLEYYGYSLVENQDYSVDYGYEVINSVTRRTAIVTVYVANFEHKIPSKNINQKTPVVISMNNKEVISQGVYITLLGTAIVKNVPVAWSITEGSLQEIASKKITDSDGNVTTVNEEVTTYTIELEIFDGSYSVGISDVTWGGKSIMKSATVSAGKGTIYLSNAKINKINTIGTETNSIVITLSNGYVITNGIKLTIINAS